MERLTIKGATEPVCARKCEYGSSLDCYDCDKHKELLNRLAAYEDTGLTPEEVKEITSWSYGPFHKKMGDWLKAEHEGRLVVLPCKVGDLLDISRLENVKCRFGTLYHIDIWDDMEDDFWLHADNGETVRVKQQDIGKTVFLTRAEAEKAMEVHDYDNR